MLAPFKNSSIFRILYEKMVSVFLDIQWKNQTKGSSWYDHRIKEVGFRANERQIIQYMQILTNKEARRQSTSRIDFERRIDTDVFNIFHVSFPQAFRVAGLHISLSDILGKKIGLEDKV